MNFPGITLLDSLPHIVEQMMIGQPGWDVKRKYMATRDHIAAEQFSEEEKPLDGSLVFSKT